MPDITMCANDDCIRKCYRRLATPSIRQSYSIFNPKNHKVCEYFLAKRRIKKLIKEVINE